MTAPSHWRVVKAAAHEIDPTWDSEERIERRARMRRRMLREQRAAAGQTPDGRDAASDQ
ncbi:hypothetical protein Cs7R123_26660 [Catellatospora sp. TT07R-123]|uniref:hypothetical protein n=1 Tax=Catellatospora sp. TT07R-123 TaxID=2733863 RepID=UPI001B2E3B10|nr:hypothetical protein [Catellatospora sp. TT07R-123]GHJ45324.1 hypothetical protein Cs7R123_26660 [Catellatospora sp. TT07R-123]